MIFEARKIAPAALFAAVMLALTATAGRAGLAGSALDGIVLTLPAGARLPIEARWNNEDGVGMTLGEALSNHAGVVIFADFTCSTLCGTMVTFAADALAQSGLRPTNDYRLIVLGIDAKDGAAQARRMKRAQIADPNIASAAVFLTADAATIRNTAAAVGYRFTYDAEHDQFAHPAAVLVAAADGRISRAVSGLGVTPDDLRLALVEASEGRVGHFADRLRLLCYGFDPAHGMYTLSVQRAIAVASGFVAALLAGMIAWLSIPPRAPRDPRPES